MVRYLMILMLLVIVGCDDEDSSPKSKPSNKSPAASPTPTPSPSPTPACANDFLKGTWVRELNNNFYYQFNDDCTVYSSQCDYTMIYPQEADYTRTSNTDPAWTNSTTAITAYATLPNPNMQGCSNLGVWINMTSVEYQYCYFRNVTQNRMEINCNQQGYAYYDRL